MDGTQKKSVETLYRIQKSINTFPVKIWNHRAIAWDNKIIVWGGWTRDDITGGCYPRDPSLLYCHHSGEWIRQQTEGDIPPNKDPDLPLNIFEAVDDKIILGTLEFESVYSLDLVTWTWTKLKSSGPPQPDGVIGMSSWIYDGNIYCFGGKSYPSQTYFNDLFCYNPSQQSWELVVQMGDLPSPRFFQKVIINADTAFLFGGRELGVEDEDHLNDLYTLDMKSMHWTKIHDEVATPNGESILPEHYSCSTLTRLSHSTAVLMSSRFNVELDEYEYECWLLDLERARELKDPSHIWTQVTNHFQVCYNAPILDPVSQSLWLIGGNDCQGGGFTSDVLKITPVNASLKDLVLDHIARNMSSDDARLLPDQIPSEIKTAIMVHKNKI